MAQDISHRTLTALLNYTPETGVFTWRQSRGRVAQGARAGNVQSNGYVYIKIDGCAHRAHRLAWLYVFGKFPDAEIDHINGVRADNRIANLRDVDRRTNCQNQRSGRGRTMLGVYLKSAKAGNARYGAQICGTSKTKHLGYFSTAGDAHAAYLAAKRELHSGCTI